MKFQFDHNLISSFYLWFENVLCNEGEAIRTGITQSFEFSSKFDYDTPSGFNSFYAENKQFFAGHTLSPSVVYINSTGFSQVTTGSSMIFIDHQNSRILLDDSFSTGVSVTGSFVEKEVNLYTVNEREDELILTQSFIVDGEDFDKTKGNSGQPSYNVPACFITYNFSENEAFALGGTKDTKIDIRIVVIANSRYQREAIFSLFRDKKDKCFNIISIEDFPYGQFWNVKSPPYNYSTYTNTNKIDTSFIEKVEPYNIGKTVEMKLNKSLSVGFIDFSISTIR
jgi:hypothetical protein